MCFGGVLQKGKSQGCDLQILVVKLFKCDQLWRLLWFIEGRPIFFQMKTFECSCSPVLLTIPHLPFICQCTSRLTELQSSFTSYLLLFQFWVNHLKAGINNTIQQRYLTRCNGPLDCSSRTSRNPSVAAGDFKWVSCLDMEECCCYTCVDFLP